MRFEEKLKEYAQLIVRVGLNVQPNQVCYVQADVTSTQLTRLVVEEAYHAGAKMVYVNYGDSIIRKLTFQRANDEVFTTHPEWDKVMKEHLRDADACFLVIDSEDPDLLTGVPATRITNARKTRGRALKSFDHSLDSGHNSWTVATAASAAWANKVFPNDAHAIDKLWEAIFAACRIGTGNAVHLWQKHMDNLENRVKSLNKKKYAALHYKGTGTDLIVGLHPKHVWLGSASPHPNGYHFVPNLPAEEIFTAPAKKQVNGTLTGTKPICYNGVIIDQFSFRFEDGRIVEAKAETGNDWLQSLVTTDEGTHYLGEVALVPHNSPISNTGILFYDTLFDENAASHFALGSAYATCIEGGSAMSREELDHHEMNDSVEHVDFMIGAANMNIDGILPDGTREAIFRKGNWSKTLS